MAIERPTEGSPPIALPLHRRSSCFKPLGPYSRPHHSASLTRTLVSAKVAEQLITHSLSQCLLYQLVLTSTAQAPSHSPAWPSSAPYNCQCHPMAHVTTSPSQASPPWLLDSGAYHHVTANLNNLNFMLLMMVQMTLSLVMVLSYILHIQAQLPYLSLPVPLLYKMSYVSLT